MTIIIPLQFNVYLLCNNLSHRKYQRQGNLTLHTSLRKRLMNTGNGRAKLRRTDSLSFALFFLLFVPTNARLNASTRITARPKHNDKLLDAPQRGQVTSQMGPTQGAQYPLQSALFFMRKYSMERQSKTKLIGCLSLTLQILSQYSVKRRSQQKIVRYEYFWKPFLYSPVRRVCVFFL